MKTTKLTTVCIAFFLGINVLFADETKRLDNENPVNQTVEKLNQTVTLTESQKIALRKAVTEYFQKREQATLQKSREDKMSVIKEAADAYQIMLDSLLTSEQKERLQIRETAQREQDIQAASDSYKNEMKK